MKPEVLGNNFTGGAFSSAKLWRRTAPLIVILGFRRGFALAMPCTWPDNLHCQSAPPLLGLVLIRQVSVTPSPLTQALPKVLSPSHAPRRSSLEARQRSHHTLWPGRRTCTEPAKETGRQPSARTPTSNGRGQESITPNQPAWVRKIPAPLGCAFLKSPHWQMGPRQEK